MKFIEIEWRDDIRGFWLDPRSYLGELPKMSSQLPQGARGFATDPGHYDFSSPRCVKDLGFETLVTPSDSRQGLEILFSPNPWKHEEALRIRYDGVESLSVDWESQAAGGGVKDSLLLDEILPADAGCRHEIALTGATILIACADLTASWEPHNP
ncbi:hypothetical protein B4N89_12065 [Embleya scabrispora]|uniref:Uncharacterized protein n=1 Tax=Embleya scabrispora TaxID=159449 RepID=A0A1T3NXN0_9ACTN|nr:hypothetical protein [Embleya scabrispora]OPC81583.1 hypothetical protein B4N89_12065 [Embleya scabrispora]